MLRQRLRGRGAGWGWTTIVGASGSGVTRLLEEAASLLREDGAPQEVFVRPLRRPAPPLEALRLAMLRPFPVGYHAGLERGLLSVLPDDDPRSEAAIDWLFARGGARPDDESVRRLLEAVAGAGPILVDDAHLLDPDSLAVLKPAADRTGIGVLAGTTDASWSPPQGTRWTLEPLALGQIQLLLRRWLRQAGTARRLAADLCAHAGGMPGRVVHVVRALAAAGHLESGPRGWRLARKPVDWPSPTRPVSELLPWAERHGPAGRFVAEALAVHGEHVDADVLAQAAAVKRAFVEEAVRHAPVPDDVAADAWPFGCAGERDAFLAAMPPERLREVRERIADAWEAMDPAGDRDARDAAARLCALAAACRAERLPAAAQRLAERLATRRRTPSDALDRLADEVHALAATHDDLLALVLDAADLCADAGRAERALRLLRRAVARQGLPRRSLPFAWRFARLEVLLHRVGTGARRLAEALERPDRSPWDPRPFDAWAILAQARALRGDPHGARRAWRTALGRLDAGDARSRAVAHRELGDVAAALGRPRAAAAHLRRGARLLAALGDRAGTVRLWLGCGRADMAASPARAIDAFREAVRVARACGDAALEASALHEAGEACIRLEAHDEAVGWLETALEVVPKAKDATGLEGRIHLALARAESGRGEAAPSRRYAALASGHDSAPEVRLRARLVLARSEGLAGAPSAAPSLHRVEEDLRGAGLREEAEQARGSRFDALLRSGVTDAVAPLVPVHATDPESMVRAARWEIARGGLEAGCGMLRVVARDANAPVHVRVEAHARLATAALRLRRHDEARSAAVAASAWLEVARRDRAEDARVHHLLATAFQALKEPGRAAAHRTVAKRLRARLGRAVLAAHDRVRPLRFHDPRLARRPSAA